MEEQLLEEHMQRLDAKIAAIGLPEEYKRIMREKAASADKGFFHLSHKTEINGVSVDVGLGFQERYEGSRYFEPDLMSVQLGGSPENVIDKNIFFMPTGSDVSIREAFNLMQGRAIRREAGVLGDDAYWLRLNLNKEFQGIRSPYIVKGHLDVAAWLRRTPLNKMYSLGEKAGMIRALEHGDRYIVDLGKTGKISLEARPEQDRVQMTNENGKQIWRIPTDNDTQRVRRKR